MIPTRAMFLSALLTFSLFVASAGIAAPIATGDCKALPSPCNSEPNVEGLLGLDLTLLAEAEQGSLPFGLSFFDGDGNAVSDPFAADLKEGSWTWAGGGAVYASAKAANDLHVYDGTSWSFDHGVSNMKLWATNPMPEPGGAALFALGLGAMGGRLRRRTR